MWYDYVTIAKVQPQAVHAAASRSLQFEWSDLQWVVPECISAFAPLRDAIHHLFYLIVATYLLDGPVSKMEIWLFDLST